MERMKTELASLLALLPEYGGSLDALCRGAAYFGVSSLPRAAEALARHHDLAYQGVRLLLSLCLEEFAALFSRRDRPVCEVSVPAPLCAVYAMQSAGGGPLFRSSALFAQIALRGILLHKAPLDPGGWAGRRCGLNRMRRRLLEDPPGEAPRFQMQFGVLCDECVKAGAGRRSFDLLVPKTLPPEDPRTRALAVRFLEDACREMGIRVAGPELRRASGQYLRLIRAEQALTRLSARGDRVPLRGNSLALAQSVQLMVTERADAWISALELLVKELEDAPKAVRPRRRAYCFFLPFLRPEIDCLFRENGVDLLGSAAFLPGRRLASPDFPSLIPAWLAAMGLRESPERRCAAIAGAMKASGCSLYLTGSFAFDRWLGADIPLQRRILEERYGIPTQFLDADFWCESGGSAAEDRVSELCALV